MNRLSSKKKKKKLLKLNLDLTGWVITPASAWECPACIWGRWLLCYIFSFKRDFETKCALNDVPEQRLFVCVSRPRDRLLTCPGCTAGTGSSPKGINGVDRWIVLIAHAFVNVIHVVTYYFINTLFNWHNMHAYSLQSADSVCWSCAVTSEWRRQTDVLSCCLLWWSVEMFGQ